MYIMHAAQAMAKRIFKAFSNSLSLSTPPRTTTNPRYKNVFLALKLYNLSLHIKSHRKNGHDPQQGVEVNLQEDTHTYMFASYTYENLCFATRDSVHNQGCKVKQSTYTAKLNKSTL